MSKKHPDGDQVAEPDITEAESKAGRLLRIAVEEAATRRSGSIRDLRIAVHQFTMTLRVAGRTPEAVLVALRKVLDQRSAPGVDGHWVDKLSPIIREQMSTWCIEDYFKDPP